MARLQRKIKLNAGDYMARTIVSINVKGIKKLKIRIFFGLIFIRLGTLIAGCKNNISYEVEGHRK